jgi:hypothetical protein
MWIALSVEYGRLIMFVMLSRSRNSAFASYLRLTIISSCMMPIWVEGPLNEVKLNFRKRTATPVSLDIKSSLLHLR